MTKAKRIALRNCASAIEADVANGAEYIWVDPDTHKELPERTVSAIEREMRAIAARLRARVSTKREGVRDE